MQCNLDLDYTKKVLCELLAIDSPTGFTRRAAEYCVEAFKALGVDAHLTKKGGVMADLGGEDTDGAILLSAHIDTLGAMVAEIKGSGNLRVRNIAGLTPVNAETEHCRIYTRDGRVYDGTFQLNNASGHVNGNVGGAPRNWDTMEIVIDEPVKCADDTRRLGIETGCYVCFDPRTVITESGYIKSRFLDDKLSTAILLGFAKYIKENNIVTKRHIYIHFTVYEEVGHGAAGILPNGVTEILGVDMGCVGDGLSCTEHEVSICAADSSGPYDYDINCALVAAAKKHALGYAVDVYPHYSSDCTVALHNYDVRAALIGAGVYASHGYERSHMDGVVNTFRLLCAYLCDDED